MKIKRAKRGMHHKLLTGLKNASVPIAIACALAAVTSQSTIACGPFSKIAIFVNGYHPDLPMNRYAMGELGVINPSYARSYLVVAYRYLKGIKTPAAKQKEFVALWQRRLETLDVSVQDAIKAWAEERKRVVGIPAKDVNAYQTNGYNGYLTYNADAFRVATQTLRGKIDKYGASDDRVRQWLKVQDQIFGATANADSDAFTKTASSATTSAPAGDTTTGTTNNTASNTSTAKSGNETQADVEYQKACDDFYNARYEAAVAKFQAIAADTSSPWQQWGDYLAARAYCRKATMGDVVIADDLKQAKKLVDKILQSTKEDDRMHANAKRLNSFLEYRLNPSERAKQVVAALTTDASQDDLTEALGDYTVILDKVLEKQTSSTPTSMRPNNDNDDDLLDKNRSLAKTSNLMDNSMFSYAALSALILFGTHRIWWRRRNNNTGLIPNSTIAVALSLSVLSFSLASCTQSGSTVKSESEESTQVVAKADSTSDSKLPSPGDVILDDDMTKWILNYQDNEPEALTKAFDEWKKSKSLPWLVSVISKIKTTDSRKAEVLSEASKVAEDSPAYLTLEYHQIRLLVDENKPKEAASRLNTLLSKVGSKLPPSTRNALFEIGVSCAGSLAEFVKLAAPSPSIITWDYDSNEMPDTDAESEPGTVKMKPTDKYFNYTGCLTPEAAEIINRVAPLPTIVGLAGDQSLPSTVRLDLAQAGWVRSVMLKNEKMAMTLSPVLGKLRPQLTKALASYDAASTGPEKEFAGLTTILRNPGMRPYVTPGLQRETAFDKIDSYRNNWWGADLPQAPRNMYIETDTQEAKKPVNAAFLSPAEIAQGRKECTDVNRLGTAPDVLAQRVLALSKAKPKDPRLAEMLHLVVTTTRYGNTDDKTTAYSKQAFQELHKNFPGNEWTKKTKFWF